MAQITIWARGREYYGNKGADLNKSVAECRCLVKAGFGDYMILDDTTLPDAILFAWGRIMWHTTQVDLTPAELKQFQ